MIPGLPPLPPHMAVHQQHLQTLLQQAWLSRANTSVTNSFTPSAFPFPNPFLPLPPTSTTTSPEAVGIHKRLEEAEDLSSLSSKRFKSDQAVCPICNIAMKWEEMPEHFQTELKCLDNIRSLSPIARPVSSSSSYRPYSSSPNKSLSLSPTSPGYAESRWQRFERIRNKRRERVGAKQERTPIKDLPEVKQEEADIDIGDSVSDCGSASDSEGCQTYGPLQYSEADVLRCLSDDTNETSEIMDSSEDENANSKAINCPTCHGVMRVPVLNVSCWHLKCEKCWLKAVGTKKCCSVCSRSASVKELRKVHL